MDLLSDVFREVRYLGPRFARRPVRAASKTIFVSFGRRSEKMEHTICREMEIGQLFAASSSQSRTVSIPLAGLRLGLPTSTPELNKRPEAFGVRPQARFFERAVGNREDDPGRLTSQQRPGAAAFVGMPSPFF